jgi:hypothetical protein
MTARLDQNRGDQEKAYYADHASCRVVASCTRIAIETSRFTHVPQVPQVTQRHTHRLSKIGIFTTKTTSYDLHDSLLTCAVEHSCYSQQTHANAHCPRSRAASTIAIVVIKSDSVVIDPSEGYDRTPFSAPLIIPYLTAILHYNTSTRPRLVIALQVYSHSIIVRSTTSHFLELSQFFQLNYPKNYIYVFFEILNS